MILTPLAVIQFAAQAGFEPALLPTMCAIVKRESGYDPSVHNVTAVTGDDSYGLWQINWAVPEIRALLRAHGILDPATLLDPATNAKAARWLYLSQKDGMKALEELWYFNRMIPDPHKPGVMIPSAYKIRYEAGLPEAQFAALQHFLGVAA